MLEKNPGLGLVWFKKQALDPLTLTGCQTAFLRLRQMCAHIFLVQEILEDLLNLESIDNMERELICGATLENKNDRTLLAALRRMVEAKPEMLEEHSEPEQEQPSELVARFGSYLKTLKANANWPELKTRTRCQSCGDSPESAFVTSCLHLYCEECLQGLANKASAQDQDETACLVCGEVFTGAEPCADLKELKWDDLWLLNESASRRKRPKKVNLEWVYYENKLVMSAKMTAVQEQVEEWLKEEPDKKIIIFSQFHMIMQILEKVCQKKKWKYCTYNGKMSHEARDKAIQEFTEDADMKIMVSSLKCGGVGLNLTMASRVICIDLWFNSCIEQQAFCRVFRIGQDADTFIIRFVVENSADGKLMDMQLRKNALITRAIDDRSVMSKLSTEDVLRLFGEIKLDKDRRPFVHLDDDEKLDSLFEKSGQD